MILKIYLYALLILVLSCKPSGDQKNLEQKPIYQERFVRGNGVTLQYLDWGGKGELLVLIAGLGDTPFLFDSLAKDLSANFHVISYSRRNHGKSKAAVENYDNATLVSDLKLLLDSLNIDKANLLGWSMGGNEITEFAALYPDRVNKLIYFEAGYDLSDDGFRKLVTNVPKPYLPDSLVMNSLDAYREWYHRFWFGDTKWNNALEANLIASVQIQPDGQIKTIPDDQTFKSILTEAMKYHRRYNDVHASSLAIFTEPFFHPADSLPATLEVFDSIENTIVTPWRSANKKRIEEELPNIVIVDAPAGSHTSFLFLSHDFLVKTIKDFLLAENK